MDASTEESRTRAERLAAWHRWMDAPLLAAAVLFLAAYSVGVLGRPTALPDLLLNVVLVVTWLLFIADYLVALALADQRLRFFVRHLPELATLVLPFLRPLALLRLLTLLRVFKRAGVGVVRGRTSVFVAGAAVLIVYTGALAELEAERGHPGASIQTFGDAIWWAVVTITTVGYGDYAPVTALGRLVAVFLMLSGIGVIGVVTATVSSWFVQQVQPRDGSDTAAQRALQDEVAGLREDVRRLTEHLGAPPPADQAVRPSR